MGPRRCLRRAAEWRIRANGRSAERHLEAQRGQIHVQPSQPLAAKSGTTKFDVTKDTLKAVVNGVDSQGRATHHEYTAKFDDYTYEAISKLKGQALATQRTVIDRDGKTRTNTVTGKNAKGQTVNHTLVYERQQGHAVKQCLSGRTTGADASHE